MKRKSHFRFDRLFSLGLASLACCASAATYHVAPSGDDAAVGSQEAPFRNIQHAATVAQPSDTVLVHAGVYRETVRPIHSGLPGQPITYKPFEKDEVVLSGTEPITGWTAAEIYFQPNKDAWSWTFTGIVTGQKGTELTFKTRNICGKDGAQHLYAIGSRYYLFNKRELLDTPGEWWLDKAAGKLHLWVPTGDDPNQHQVEARQRDWAFYLDGLSHITIQGFKLFACTITTDGEAGDGQQWDADGNDRYPWRSGDSLHTRDLGKAGHGAREAKNNWEWDRKIGSPTDPKFVNAASADFRLMADSPVRGKGIIVPTCSTQQPGNPETWTTPRKRIMTRSTITRSLTSGARQHQPSEVNLPNSPLR